MPNRLNSLLTLVILLAGTSMAANGFLTWQWLTERQNLRTLVAEQSINLKLTGNKNKKLSQENLAVKEELSEKDLTLAEKDQQLVAKVAELAKKQAELNTLSTTLETKQAELSTAQKQIDDQKSQLSANSTELSKLRTRPPLFSFQVKSNKLQDVETKKAAVKQVVTDAYEVIESIYGKPYLLHSVTITFVESFQNDKASGEIVITNSSQGLDYDIHIKDFNRDSFNDTNTIIHEVLHSFHGLAVLSPTAFEEGMTVAAADVVMAKMIEAGKLPRFSSLYIQLSNEEFATLQRNLTIPRSDSELYASAEVATFYQVLGKAWQEIYQLDNNFFTKFNELIYAKKNAGETISEQQILDSIKSIVPKANLTGAAWQLK